MRPWGAITIFTLGVLVGTPLHNWRSIARRSFVRQRYKSLPGSSETTSDHSDRRVPVKVTLPFVEATFTTASWYTTTWPVLWQNERLCGPAASRRGDMAVLVEVLSLN